MVGAIALGDGRWINEARAGRIKDGCGIERNPWDGRKEERRRDASRKGRKGASDGKTVMGSESEDKYSDREPHKRERSSAGAGIRGCERAERNRGRERGG